MLQKLRTFFPIAEKVWDRKSTLPVISHICVEGGFMRMTDLEISVKMPVDDNRKYTIPIKILKKVFNTKPKELRIVLINDKKAKLFFDNKSISFPFENTENYPLEPEGKFQYTSSWSKEVLIKLFNQIPFTSTDELKNTLLGVYVHQNKKLSTCATDGFVLQYNQDIASKNECKLDKDFSEILPVKCIQLLAKFAHGSVKVFSGKDRIKFLLPGDIELTSNTIEGVYPNFYKVIPSSFNGEVIIDKKALSGSVKQTKPFANPGNNKAVFTFNNGSMNIKADNPDEETCFETSLPTRNRKGEDLTIGLSLELLEIALSGVQDDQICWKYNDSNSASIMVDPADTENNTINLIMPIKLKE